jgi:hypothetical protein
MPAPLEEGMQITECRISLDLGAKGRFLELRITEPSLIKELVEDPLNRGQADPDPARYVVKGSIVFKRKDGSQEGLVLFHPWGRYKLADKYFITDFSLIQQAFQQSISQAQQHLK